MIKILLIDDDEPLRLMTKKMLEQSGFEVLDAQDGMKAMELYRSNSADVVITDLIMPEQEGIETIRQIINLNPAAKIIAVSGGGRIGPEMYLDMAERIGAKFALKKPYRREELLAAINACLSNTFKQKTSKS